MKDFGSDKKNVVQANLDAQKFPVPLGVYYRQERPVFNLAAPQLIRASRG